MKLTEKLIADGVIYNPRHGGPYDRGSADSYYGRPFNPHYFTGATYDSVRLEEVDMSEEEIAAYKEGFEDNEESGDRKKW